MPSTTTPSSQRSLLRRGLVLLCLGALLAGVASFASAEDNAPPESVQPAPSEPMSQAEAQKVLDPENDSGLIIHQLKSGAWTTFSVNYLGGLPDEIETSAEFSRYVAEQRIRSGDAPENADVETLAAEGEAQLSCMIERTSTGTVNQGDPPPSGCEEGSGK